MRKELHAFCGFIVGVVSVLTMGQIQWTAPARAQAADGAPELVKVDEAHAIPIYANFARVTGTPDEVIIALGLLTELGQSVEPIRIHHQVVMSYPTVKRTALALNATIERYEGAFGTIEVDARKRVRD
jgi:hypothetical protein